MDKETKKNIESAADTSERVAGDRYDPHLVPAETAARREREGDTFKTVPTLEREEESRTNDRTEDDSIRTTDGYTVDKEGLLNNYAIEPEMYINEPGDLRERDEQLAAERSQEMSNLKEDEEGKLTMEQDSRPRGQGMV
ncbi:hypothetical protein H6S82_17570 [Planktothrix sp. FACHB-1355]|uniref:Uncharacterized protein n=1 Tax=Aerosakkonema funiforme FACHB-1375 TaxID=2949571 RepID=A0A926VKS6_9CYAN|nr:MULTISPECIES: hypothetical protein [Oscillatoriales]MBD2185641.1 hypothetical protein [Aerosakkonema funiforme FACHB-1375]MBD3560646.1 hypothetical protein [Planktothrix sp. FACHB-1355]